MHPNSQLAHEAEKTSGKLSRRAAEILRWLLAHPRPWTDREIAHCMGYPDMNCVRPRITELVQMGLLEEADSVICKTTGKRVRRVVPFTGQGEFSL